MPIIIGVAREMNAYRSAPSPMRRARGALSSSAQVVHRSVVDKLAGQGEDRDLGVLRVVIVMQHRPAKVFSISLHRHHEHGGLDHDGPRQLSPPEVLISLRREGG